MKRQIILLFILFLALDSVAQIQRGLILSVDTQIILIGEQINMTLELRSASSDEITFPNLGDTLVKNMEIVSRKLPDTLYHNTNKNQRTIRQSLVLTSFDTGIYTIKPLCATINGDSAFSQSFRIGVFTYPIDSTDTIVDIKGNISEPLTFMDYVDAYWHYVAGILAFLLFVFVIWYLFVTRKKKPVEDIVIEPGIPAHLLALQRLINLEDKKLWQGGKFKEYHVRLSEIVREYLENRYEILAMEQTTEEILDDLKPIRLDQNVRANLKDLLQLMDLVKFAKMQPTDSENLAVIAWSKNLIEKTKEKITENAKEDSE